MNKSSLINTDPSQCLLLTLWSWDAREVLVEKHYRGLLPRTVCDLFWDEVQKAESHTEVKPVIVASRFYLIHIQVNKLFFLAVTQQETDTLLAIEFLGRFVDILKYYFGSDTPITEAVIKERFITVYQVRNTKQNKTKHYTSHHYVETDQASFHLCCFVLCCAVLCCVVLYCVVGLVISCWRK